MEDKIRLQSGATKKYYEQIFEEMKELEESKSKVALRKSTLCGYIRLKEKEGCLERDEEGGGHTGLSLLQVMQVIGGGLY